VLIVDDDPAARELFSVVLQNAGAEVAVADSSLSALAVLRTTRIDVLISDIEMPETDGYTLVSQALAMGLERNSDLVAIAVSAHTRPEDEARSLTSGFRRHLSKPVDPAVLVSAVIDAARASVHPAAIRS
jgi:CheY-like chemotaxis protein